jgi:hypothetical protein
VGLEHSRWYQGLCWGCTKIEMIEGKTKKLETKNKKEERETFKVF